MLDGRHVVYVGALDERELRNVFIQTLEADGDLSITTGDKGPSAKATRTASRHVILDHGYRYRGTPGRGDYEMLRFERATVRVDTAPPPRAWQYREALPLPAVAGIGASRPWSPSCRCASIARSRCWSSPCGRRCWPGPSRREGRYGRIVAAVLIQAIYFNLVGVGESWLIQGIVDSRGSACGGSTACSRCSAWACCSGTTPDTPGFRAAPPRDPENRRDAMILDRYIFRTVAGRDPGRPAGAAAARILSDPVGGIGGAWARADYDFAAALRYLALIQPQRLYELFPMALLVGGLLGMGALAAGSELIVMRAAGLSLTRLTRSAAASRSPAQRGGAGDRRVRCRRNWKNLAKEQRAMAKSENMAIRGGRGFWARDGDHFIHVRASAARHPLGGHPHFQDRLPNPASKAITAAQGARYQRRPLGVGGQSSRSIPERRRGAKPNS
ncbi:MAG: LptF/LptG family permease [Candidatus Competibacter sp.]